MTRVIGVGGEVAAGDAGLIVSAAVVTPCVTVGGDLLDVVLPSWVDRSDAGWDAAAELQTQHGEPRVRLVRTPVTEVVIPAAAVLRRGVAERGGATWVEARRPLPEVNQRLPAVGFCGGQVGIGADTETQRGGGQTGGKVM
jgi:hypothetical protein